MVERLQDWPQIAWGFKTGHRGKNNAKIFGYSEPLIGEKKDPFGDNLDQ